jgi:NAD(P)-dependent dehydrogenase (short-subunit alcohol dehydrogenase family)
MTGEPERPVPRPERGGAVITGVGWGAGLALARTLAGHGYAVHVTDADGALATGAAEELGPPAFGSALDVRSPAACRAAAARTRRRAGSLEIWINNATAPSSGLAWELDERTRQRVLEVNLVGTINGTLAALEVMRAAGRGQVINVIPLPKVFFAPGQAVFSASRQAAIAFSVGVAADLRRAGPVGVSVSCLCPTGVSGDDEAPPSGTQQLAGLLRLALDDRAPLLVTPEWRARLLRLYYLWPGPAATARRLLGGGGR